MSRDDKIGLITLIILSPFLLVWFIGENFLHFVVAGLAVYLILALIFGVR